VLCGLQKQYREAEASALRASSASVNIADTDDGDCYSNSLTLYL